MRTEGELAASRYAARNRREKDRQRRTAVTLTPGGRSLTLPAIPRATESAQSIDFGHVLRVLRRRSWLVVLFALIGLGAGFWVQSQITPRYTSSVSLLLEPKRADSFGAETQFGTVMVDSAKIASVVSVIESADMLGRVVVAERLDTVPEFGDPRVSVLRRWLGMLPFMEAPKQDNSTDARLGRALDRLARAVRVDRVGMTYVLEIEVAAGSAELAHKLAGAIASTYLDDQVVRKTATTQRDSLWLGQRLQEVSANLERDEEAVDRIRKQYGLVETDHGPNATTDRQAITDLNAQLTQAQADVATKRAKYDQVNRIRTSGGSLETLSEAANSQVIMDLRKTQADIAARLADLSANYNPGYPEIRRLKEHQAAVDRQIGAEVSRLADGLRNDYETAVARERDLQARMDAATRSEGGGDSAEGRVKLREAQRAAEASRSLYDSLMARWRDVQQQQTREEPEGRVISQASLPDRPSSPKPFLFPAAGAVVFLLFGLGLTVGPAVLSRRYTSIADVEKRLGLLVLGAMPKVRRRDLRFARRKLSMVDYATRKPLSPFAESLRSLRAYLRISPDSAPTVMQVTSSVPGEGKTTTAAALAVSAASAGVSTVLVDADVRSAALSAMFGLRDEEGLAEVLQLGVPFRSVSRDIGNLPLTVIGAGSMLMSRPDVVDSSRMAALLRELTDNYSLVILDSPPVLAVSDALVLSKHADATVLVIQWQSTTRDLVDSAVKMLRSVAAPLVGVMLNKIDLSKVGQYEYGYKYEYGPRYSARPGARPQNH
jgi:polysaccharide biosynthesis transport protein